MVFIMKTGLKNNVISETNTMIRETKYDFPELKKCLFCIPFKPALITWAILQAGWITYITIIAMVNYFSYRFTYSWTVTPMFVFTMIVSAIEISVMIFLLFSTLKSKWENINFCYNYTLLKIMAYVSLIIVSQFFYICCHSENWFYYHIDPIRYQVLRENPIAGLFECVILGYMALVMRSYVIQLGGRPHCLCCRRKEPSENLDIKQAFAYDEKTDIYEEQNLHTVS